MNSGRKAIVIGAGIGGLAVSVRLAVRGYEVTVFEASSLPGGKIGELQFDGFRFDTGPSLFTLPQLVDELFKVAKENPRDYFNYKKLEELCGYFYEDGTRFTAFADQNKFENEISTHLKSDGKELIKYLRKSSKLYSTYGEIFLNKPLNKLKTYFSPGVLPMIFKPPLRPVFSTLNHYNRRNLKNLKLITYFNRYATYNGSNPFRAPGMLALIPHLEHNEGAYYPEGGMYKIADAVYKLALRKGVKFDFNQKVERIITKKGKVEGVRVDGKETAADVVVSNADVYFTYKNLLPDVRHPEKQLSQPRSSSALVFFWGIKGTFPELNLHNIFFSGDYKKEFQQIFDDKSVSDDPTVYINITSKMTPADAPPGHENWFVMINAPHSDQHDESCFINQSRESIINKLTRLLSKDIESLIRCERILSPQGIEQKTGSYLGALYGPSSDSRMSAFLRHPNSVRSIKNLYFCGGSVHPGGGIPLCLHSAKIVSDLIKR